MAGTTKQQQAIEDAELRESYDYDRLEAEVEEMLYIAELGELIDAEGEATIETEDAA